MPIIGRDACVTRHCNCTVMCNVLAFNIVMMMTSSNNNVLVMTSSQSVLLKNVEWSNTIIHFSCPHSLIWVITADNKCMSLNSRCKHCDIMTWRSHILTISCTYDVSFDWRNFLRRQGNFKVCTARLATRWDFHECLQKHRIRPRSLTGCRCLWRFCIISLRQRLT